MSRSDLEAVDHPGRASRAYHRAGGSIGSETARQVALCEPAKLIMVEHDETHLFEAAATLAMEAVQVLADIRDATLVEGIMARQRLHVVFLAAAHKHVPLLEEHPCEAVHTNVIGTANVVRAAARMGVKHVCSSPRTRPWNRPV